MQITTRQMRKAVKGWLTEENATEEQALMLLDALYAGVIDGSVYVGRMGWDDSAVVEVERSDEMYDLPDPVELSEEDETESTSGYCGCLVDTFERIAGVHGKRTGSIEGDSLTAFSFALLLRKGDTPSNSKWARATERGIEDYVREVAA